MFKNSLFKKVQVICLMFFGKIVAPVVRSLPSDIKDGRNALYNFMRFQFPGRRQTYCRQCGHYICLAELVLTLTWFSCADTCYKLINDVAMGTKMGPSYANNFVG